MTNSSDHQEPSAPQRPKLWLLRTRRFWFGVWMLILLIGNWIGSILFDGGIERIQSSVHTIETRVGGLSYYLSNFWWVDYDSGCFSVHWGKRNLSVGFGSYEPPPEVWNRWFQKADAIRSEPGMENYPIGPCYFPKMIGSSGNRESIQDGQAGTLEYWITLPLWLPVLFWLIIWPLWIRRLTRKEATHFEKLQ